MQKIVNNASKNLMKRSKMIQVMDGNQVASHVTYTLSENFFLYPITPSSPIGDIMDKKSVTGEKNLFGNNVMIKTMQSEMGVIGSIYGSVQAGSLTATATTSQGLLLMVPTLFRLVGENLPAVLQVPARAVASHSHSIFAEHSDVMALRQTGAFLFASANAQEIHDSSLIAHLSAVSCSIPVVNFFDGFRTSHEVQKIEVLEREEIVDLIDEPELEFVKKAIWDFKQNNVTPNEPETRGVLLSPEIFFQIDEAKNYYFKNAPEKIQKIMDVVESKTGRKQGFFDYYGAEDAENVIVLMGSGANTVKEVVDYINESGEGSKVGVVNVRVYRPWNLEKFIEALPRSVKRLGVLDKTKEKGALGNPLFLDVTSSVSTAKTEVNNSECCEGEYKEFLNKLEVFGGTYGLGGKEFYPVDVVSVFRNLERSKPKQFFTVGIVDDVYGSSLHNLVTEEDKAIRTLPPGTEECVFYGIGGDGTIGANQTALKLIGENTPFNTQGYFYFDARKQGGATVSFLRFNKDHKINSSYFVTSANYVSCGVSAWLNQYDLVKTSKENSIFVINTDSADLKDLEELLPDTLKQKIAKKNLQFYVIDASSISRKYGLGGHINNIMQTCFFKLSTLLNFEEAITLFKNQIAAEYKTKGEEVIARNLDAIDEACESLIKIDYPKEEWSNLKVEKTDFHKSNTLLFETENYDDLSDFVKEIQIPANKFEGDDIPVSTFYRILGHNGKDSGRASHHIAEGGSMKYEKRGVAMFAPHWDSSKCIQCNTCSFMCPTGSIRPFLITEAESEDIAQNICGDKEFFNPIQSRNYKYTTESGEEKNYNFVIQATALDCSGVEKCGLCVKACPMDALSPKETQVSIKEGQTHKTWSYLTKIQGGEDRGKEGNPKFNKFSVEGSQLKGHYFQFPSVCGGCGAAQYVKLLTQLFGERLVTMLASGCTAANINNFPNFPYATDSKGQGPAFSTLLFENNAELGYGYTVATNNQRQVLKSKVEDFVSKYNDNVSLTPKETEFVSLLNNWIDSFESTIDTLETHLAITASMEDSDMFEGDEEFYIIKKMKDHFLTKSSWIVGGDGWANDIGSAGLLHVLASPENTNVLVLDTEVYSNTGGQTSKATPVGASAKFADSGKEYPKIDLGLMSIVGMKNIYVATVAVGANPKQFLKAMKEAEEFDGPSLIIAYSPCIAHAIDGGLSNLFEHEKLVVESGYWPLYRYNPTNEKDKLQIDYKNYDVEKLQDLLKQERRFSYLSDFFPERSEKLFEHLKNDTMNKQNMLKLLQENLN